MKCDPCTGLPTRRSLLATAADRRSRVTFCMREARRIYDVLRQAPDTVRADQLRRDLHNNVRYARDVNRAARDLRNRALAMPVERRTSSSAGHVLTEED